MCPHICISFACLSEYVAAEALKLISSLIAYCGDHKDPMVCPFPLHPRRYLAE